jgi:hypothetical protein
MNDSITELLSMLKRQGVVLTVDGDNLKVDAPQGVLHPEIIKQLRKAKTELLRRLTNSGENDGPHSPTCKNNHFRLAFFCDGPPEHGRTRTVCRLCGRFIGYRPSEPSRN